MSNFEYKNISEIMSDDFPKNGITLSLQDVELLKKQIVIPDFDRNSYDEISGESDFRIELHVFLKNLVYAGGNYDIQTYSVLPSSEYPKLRLNVHRDIREMNLPTTEYKVVYNVLRNVIGGHDSRYNVFVSEISSDRTELKISLANPELEVGRKLISRFVIENIRPKTFVPPIVLNFGENKLVDVINVTSNGDPTSFFVKLYNPLPQDIQTYFVCWVSIRLMKPYIDSIQILEDAQQEDIQYISGPNFEVDYDYWTTTETNYKNWSDLLSQNVSTSEQILNTYISGSGNGIQLNVDFSEFKNFIYYSSAQDRVENFFYKMELLEYYKTEIGRLSLITGSVEMNRTKIQLLRDNLVSGMDSFEKYLMNSSTGSFNYTFQLSSSVVPFPKMEMDSTSSFYDVSTIEGKYNFYSVTSSFASSWYEDIIEKAIEHDTKNIYALNKSLPDYIKESADNEGAVTFTNMLGQHFDVMFLYTDHILKKNLREEHPNDGLSQDLVYDVAKNMGWTLTHGTSAKDLWEYALGVNDDSQPIWTGNTTVDKYLSKTYEGRTKEVWRRILNNLPYVYKSKGTSRSIKALLASYGIPETILTIREYGGPDNADLGVKPRANWKKHTYFLNMHSSYPLPTTQQYISVPWEKANTQQGYYYPDSIEFRWKMPTKDSFDYSLQPIQTVLQKNVASRVDWFVTVNYTGSNAEKGNVNFYIGDGTTYSSASINDVYLFDEIPLNLMVRRTEKNDSLSSNHKYEVFLGREKYGKIVSFDSSSVVVSGSVTPNIQRAWVSPGTLFIGSGSNSVASGILSGSVFELRYWNNPLSVDSFENHVLAARSYNGNTSTSSFYDLTAQYQFWKPFDVFATSSIASSHPNQKITSFQTSSNYATFVGFTSNDFESTVESYNMLVPTVGNNTPFSEKVRVDSGSLIGSLRHDASSEVSAFDNFSVDSDRLMVAFSPQSIVNEDIYESIGNESIDDYFGEYSNIDSDEYPRLRWFAREYWKKYSNKNDISAYLKLISIFDFSIFDQIRQALPLRVNPIIGLVIEPNVLERSKVRVNKGILGEPPSNFGFSTNHISSSVSNTSGSYTTRKATIHIGTQRSDVVNYVKYIGDASVGINFDGSTTTRHNGDIDFEFVATGSNSALNCNVTNTAVDINNQITFFEAMVPPSIAMATAVSNKFMTTANGSRALSSGVRNNLDNGNFIDTSFTMNNIRENAIFNNGVWGVVPQGNNSYISIGMFVDTFRDFSYYDSYKFFYTSSNAIVDGIFASSSFVVASVENPHDLVTGVRNHRFDGCKISSPDINVDTKTTPDGKSVVVIMKVDPNQETTDDGIASSINGSILIV
jgi:hypothetical protein